MIEKELYDKVVKLTKTNYQLKDYMCNDEIFNWIIDDLIYLIEDLKDEINNLEEDIEDNYRPIPYEEQIGYNPKDFY